MSAPGVAAPIGASPSPAASPGGRTILLTGVVVAVVAFVVALVFVWVALSHPAVYPGGPTIQGSALAVSPPIGTSSAGHHWYNFSAESVSGGLRLDNMVFQVQTPSGAVVPAAAGWTLQILGNANAFSGPYTYSTLNQSWSSTASTGVTSGDTISLNSGASVLRGDEFVVLGAGSFQGSISVSIP